MSFWPLYWLQPEACAAASAAYCWTCTASVLVVLEMGTLVTSRLGMNDSSVDSDCLIACRLGVDDSGEEGGTERLGRSHAGIVRRNQACNLHSQRSKLTTV